MIALDTLTGTRLDSKQIMGRVVEGTASSDQARQAGAGGRRCCVGRVVPSGVVIST